MGAMPYLHVFLSLEPEPEKYRCVLHDLSEESLKKAFLRPYKSGTRLLCGNEVIPLDKIRRVKIVATDEKSEITLDQMRRASSEAFETFNREARGAVLLGIGLEYDINDLAAKLDVLAEKALKDHAAGKTTPL